MRRENYNPNRGMSFEYNNFFLTLKNMKDVEVVEYPFDLILEVGKEKYNEHLLDLVRAEKPDLLFVFMYTDELNPKTLLAIKNETKTVSVAWFADDYWRFFNYSKFWPPYFDFVVTTYSRAVAWYNQAGFQNVIRSQWGANTELYKPVQAERDIEVSFVGQYKSARGRLMKKLEQNGIKVEAFGYGWPNGKVSQEEMLSIFSRSKINLNINARPGLFSSRVIARIFLKKSIDKLVPDYHFIDNLKAYFHFPILHTHARPFELAGCGGFVISGYSEDIGDYYKENQEMVFYKTENELIEKIGYYLAHREERERIAKAAYERTIREHTYEARFRELFRQIENRKILK